MRSTTKRFVMAAMMAACLLGARTAPAGLLVDQSPPTTTTTALVSDIFLPRVFADDFVLGSAASADTIKFWGNYGGPSPPASPDLFSLAFYDDDAGLPGPLVASVSIAATRTYFASSFGVDIYEYTASFTATALSAGKHWISVVNDTTGTPGYWGWSVTGPPFNGVTAYSGEGSRTPSSWSNWSSRADLAFVLSGSSRSTVTTPEPSTLLSGGLAAVAGLGLAWRHRRRGNAGAPGPDRAA